MDGLIDCLVDSLIDWLSFFVCLISHNIPGGATANDDVNYCLYQK